MIEDSLVIYRLSRAPERRIFYIDVGNLPKVKAEQYLRDVMMRYRNKLVYDSNSGEIRDDKKMMSMLEDFWLPAREVAVQKLLHFLAGRTSENWQTLSISSPNSTDLWEYLNLESLDLGMDSTLVVLLKSCEMNSSLVSLLVVFVSVLLQCSWIF